MKKNKFNLDEILENDPLGILSYKKKNFSKTNNDRLLESFLEINKFYEENDREPKKGLDLFERNLYATLVGIKEKSEKIKYLKSYDKYNLLIDADKKIPSIETIDDIFNNDPLGILENNDIDIFILKNIPEIKKDRANADFISRREKCEDFERYESIFNNIQSDLKKGTKKIKKFEHGDIKNGGIFVDKGILVFIKSLEMNTKKDSFGKEDGRLLCIFENGTKSNIKFRTLQKSLEIDGRTVVEDNNVFTISDTDIETGYIYILKSLSNDDRILTMKNLYKIGFSSGGVQERIKNAEKDPTYLMAPVAIVSSFKVVNMNPHRLEQLLHKFFGNSRLNIDIISSDGQLHTPREWFVAPLGVIEAAIKMITDGSILNYRYDGESEEIKIIKN